MIEELEFDVGDIVRIVQAPYFSKHLVGRHFHIVKIYDVSNEPPYVVQINEKGETHRFDSDDLELVKKYEDPVIQQTSSNGSFKSDGGSSDYYQHTIPEGMLKRWNDTGKIEAKDVMKIFLDNDYNFCNSFKAHARVVSLRKGMGKDGITERYDLRKAVFFAEDALSDYDENRKKD